MGWWNGLRARLGLLFRGGAAEARMEEEIGFHVDMEAERLEREEGLDPVEARRRALVAFGGVERTKEELREGRGLAWLSGLRLDLKLGARMLVKYPVLTGASVLALALAVGLAVSFFEFMSNMAWPRFPLPEADRIVQLRLQDEESGDRERRALYDFERWRDELDGVEELTAVTTSEMVVRTEDERFATLEGARVTPSMFRFSRLRPLHGRPLRADDAEATSPAVAVLAYSAWRRLFDGDPGAIGRTLRVGSETATVVGVMPEGFEFPSNQQVWLPLRVRAVEVGPRDGPPLTIFARLARGVSLDEARAELEVVGRRISAAHPATHEQLRPRVDQPSTFGPEAALAGLLNLPFLFFMLVVAANVATLLFARTATREGEIAMRTALGASRRRIVLQMTAEALVLTLTASAVGLLAARWAFSRAMALFFEVQQARMPFWFDTTLSLRGVLYVLALAAVAALIIGGLPALRATRGGLRHRLTSTGTGVSSMKLGTVATAAIVVQVAITVAFVPLALDMALDTLPERTAEAFPADRYLYGRLTVEHHSERGADDGLGEDVAGEASYDEVHRRLLDEAGVVAATRASWLPGFNHVMSAVEVEGDSVVHHRRVLGVDPNFFEVLGARIVSGRGFRESDREGEAAVAVVDRAAVDVLFGGRNALGRRIRILGSNDEAPGPWHRIVGVVEGMAPAIGPGQQVGLYRPLRPERHGSIHVFARTREAPDELVPRVHDLVEAVDPSLGMAELKPLEAVWRPVHKGNSYALTALAAVAAVIVFFALMGIYALTAFTVERRAREIGIRSALGANPRRLLAAIFSRVVLQIGVGIAAGATLVGFALADEPGGLMLIGAVALAMLVVGGLGASVPAARALRIQPTDALRAE
jgi:putative ABC transport system permease protein